MSGQFPAPWIMDALQRAADRVARGDTLETIEGTLVHAQIGDVTLDVAPLHDEVLLTIQPPGQRMTVALLDKDEARALHHALGTFLWPYGTPDPLLPESPKHVL